MRVGWEWRRLGDMCEVIAGQSPDGQSYNATSEGMPFYQGKKAFGARHIGTPTAWIGLPAGEARSLAALLTEKADELDKRKA